MVMGAPGTVPRWGSTNVVARYDGSAAIVFIDLDHFKSINDQFGHLAGDATLQVVSDTIVRSCRNSDVVARFGGDEFAVLLWNLTEQDAHAKARSFEKRIDALRVRLAAECVSVGASAVVAMLGGVGLAKPGQQARRCRHVFPENGKRQGASARARRVAGGLLNSRRSLRCAQSSAAHSPDVVDHPKPPDVGYASTPDCRRLLTAAPHDLRGETSHLSG